MRRATLIAAVCGLALIAAPGAFAASPNAIYRDFADNGRLDGRYSVADLERVLTDAVVQGYGGPGGKTIEPAIKKKIAEKAKPKEGVAPAVKPVEKPGPLPFTGLDLALISFGGLALLLLGATVRRLARKS